MQNKKFGVVSIFVTLSLSYPAFAGTVGTYRVNDEDIISVQGSVGIFKVLVPSETLAAISDVTKPGDTIVLKNSEWTITDPNSNSESLPLISKNDPNLKLDLVSSVEEN